MPRLTAFHVPALEDLARQLRFLPRARLLEDAARAEALAGDVEPGVRYPVEWIVFRVTGHRPDAPAPVTGVGAAGDAGAPTTVAGEHLLADLSALVERLTLAARLREDEAPAARTLSLEDLRTRWGVTSRTLERYRRRGLVARRIDLGAGRSRIAFPLEAVERFERAHPELLRSARAFTRVGEHEEADLLRRAARYRARLGWSVNRAAARLALKTGRSREGLRKLLLARLPDAPPALDARARARQRELAFRAARRGLPPATLAARLGVPVARVRRLVAGGRAARLRALALAGAMDTPGETPTPAATASALAAAPALRGLGAPGHDEIGALLEFASRRTPAVPFEESARALASLCLRARARAALHTMDASAPGAGALDRVETDLRWAARLKAELLRAQLSLVVATLEERLGPLRTRRAPDAVALLRAALAAASDAIDQHDPRRGGRLAAPVALAVTRVAARWAGAHPPAGMNTSAGAPAPDAITSRPRAERALHAPMPDWTLALCPWQPVIEHDPRVRAVVAQLPALERRALALRAGWESAPGDGQPPRTLLEAAPLLGLSPVRLARVERAALARALSLARSGATPPPPTAPASPSRLPA